MIDQRTRTNAVIGYCFLGWIFLLARNNPVFQHPFVRKHAWIATRIHVGFFVTYLAFVLVFQQYLTMLLPVVNVSVGQIVFIGICFFFTYLIVRGIYGVLHSDDVFPAGYASDSLGFISGRADELASVGTSERDRMIGFLSFVPFLGCIVARHHPSRLTDLGERLSNAFAIILVAVSVGTSAGSVMMLFLLAYMGMLSYIGVYILTGRPLQLPVAVTRIPSIDEVYVWVRAGLRYARVVLLVVIGRHDALDWAGEVRTVRERDARSESLLSEYYTDDRLIVSPYLIACPIVNLLLVPRLLSVGQNLYIRAITQGITLTILLVIVWSVYGMDTSYQVWALFAVVLSVATVRTRPFYRIPIVYECSLPISFLVFGLVDHHRRLAEKNKNLTVSYKIDG